MTRFYYVKNIHYPEALTMINLDHQTCLGIASRKMDTNVLSKDVEAWRDKAKPGDVFDINYHEKILVLDL